MVETKKKVKRKNPSQVAKGKKRSEGAKRDAKGRFEKTEKKPTQHPAESPAQASSLIITTHNLEYKGSEALHPDCHADGESGKEFERHIDKAMRDEYWLELMIRRTGLPLKRKKTEVADIFKAHVIRMGKEEEITSEKKAKAYFNNFARKGTPTHWETRQELERQAKDRKEDDPHRYEDINPETGQRTYYGIEIPEGAPPRPNENAVYLNDKWTV